MQAQENPTQVGETKPIFVGSSIDLKKNYEKFTEANPGLDRYANPEEYARKFFNDVFGVDYDTIPQTYEVLPEFQDLTFNNIGSHIHRGKFDVPFRYFSFDVNVPGDDGRIENGQRITKTVFFREFKPAGSRVKFEMDFFRKDGANWVPDQGHNDGDPWQVASMAGVKPPLVHPRITL